MTKHADNTFFEEGAESEVANILNGLSQLGYRNEELTEVLYSYLVGKDFAQTGEISEQYDLHTLYNILTSFARLSPGKTKYFTDFAPQLHYILSSINKTDPKEFENNPNLIFMLCPDITIYVNMWLSLATFGALQHNY